MKHCLNEYFTTTNLQQTLRKHQVPWPPSASGRLRPLILLSRYDHIPLSEVEGTEWPLWIRPPCRPQHWYICLWAEAQNQGRIMGPYLSTVVLKCVQDHQLKLSLLLQPPAHPKQFKSIASPPLSTFMDLTNGSLTPTGFPQQSSELVNALFKYLQELQAGAPGQPDPVMLISACIWATAHRHYQPQAVSGRPAWSVWLALERLRWGQWVESLTVAQQTQLLLATSPLPERCGDICHPQFDPYTFQCEETLVAVPTDKTTATSLTTFVSLPFSSLLHAHLPHQPCAHGRLHLRVDEVTSYLGAVHHFWLQRLSLDVTACQQLCEVMSRQYPTQVEACRHQWNAIMNKFLL